MNTLVLISNSFNNYDRRIEKNFHVKFHSSLTLCCKKDQFRFAKIRYPLNSHNFHRLLSDIALLLSTTNKT